MDSLTHVVLGAAIGEAMLGKSIGKKGMLWGALANSLPDVDVIANAFTNPVDALLIHRGITHSFFFAIVISPLLAYVFFKSLIRQGITFKHWLSFFLIAIIAHDLIDTCTCYGTGLLEPFSQKRFSTNSIFVADPLFTLPLLISFIVLLILKRTSAKRKLINLSCLFLSCSYLVFTFVNKSKVDGVARQSFNQQNIAFTNYMTTPAPLNNILWNVIAKTDSGYYTGYYSLMDRNEKIEFAFFPTNETLTSVLPSTKTTDKLKIFSQGFYTFSKSNNELVFSDIRFGQAGGWEKKDARFVFSYNLVNEADNLVVIKRMDFEFSLKEALQSLLKRIKGN